MIKTIENDSAIYTITSNGDVFTESKIKIPIVGSGMKFTGKTKLIVKKKRRLKSRINNRGYESVSLSGKTKMVHRLVAELFMDNPDGKPQVNHLDGNKLNNKVENLEWCTNRENTIHAIATGLKSESSVEKSNLNLVDNSKLSKEEVLFIRKNFKNRDFQFGLQPMSEKFKVSRVAISNVVNLKTYTKYL